jgi:Zn-finger protein
LLKLKQVKTCQSCYWANPEQHVHVAMEQIRRVDLVFGGEEAQKFDELRQRCKRRGKSVAQGLKELLIESGE